MKHKRFGDLLVGAGVITQDQLEAALQAQKGTKHRLGQVLIDEGFITERQLIDTLVMQLGIDFIDLSTVDIDSDMTALVPKNLAKKYSVVPVRTRGDDLFLAMSDPLNFIASEEVKAASRKHVVPMIATQSSIDHAIASLYGTEGAKRAIKEMQQENPEGTSGDITNDLVDDRSDAAPSIRDRKSVV